MMLELLIQHMCQNQTMYHREACNKGTEAMSKQSQVWQAVDNVEKQGIDTVRTTMGESSYKIGLTGFSFFKMARDKRVVYRFRKSPISDTILLQASPNSSKIDFTWRIP